MAIFTCFLGIFNTSFFITRINCLCNIFIRYRSYYCDVTRWPDKRCLSHCMCLYQVIMTLYFLNDVVNDIESTRKSIITP